MLLRRVAQRTFRRRQAATRHLSGAPEARDPFAALPGPLRYRAAPPNIAHFATMGNTVVGLSGLAFTLYLWRKDKEREAAVVEEREFQRRLSHCYDQLKARELNQDLFEVRSYFVKLKEQADLAGVEDATIEELAYEWLRRSRKSGVNPLERPVGRIKEAWRTIERCWEHNPAFQSCENMTELLYDSTFGVDKLLALISLMYLEQMDRVATAELGLGIRLDDKSERLYNFIRTTYDIPKEWPSMADGGKVKSGIAAREAVLREVMREDVKGWRSKRENLEVILHHMVEWVPNQPLGRASTQMRLAEAEKISEISVDGVWSKEGHLHRTRTRGLRDGMRLANRMDEISEHLDETKQKVVAAKFDKLRARFDASNVGADKNDDHSLTYHALKAHAKASRSMLDHDFEELLQRYLELEQLDSLTGEGTKSSGQVAGDGFGGGEDPTADDDKGSSDGAP